MNSIYFYGEPEKESKDKPATEDAPRTNQDKEKEDPRKDDSFHNWENS